jgi:hypothetical protein
VPVVAELLEVMLVDVAAERVGALGEPLVKALEGFTDRSVESGFAVGHADDVKRCHPGQLSAADG